MSNVVLKVEHVYKTYQLGAIGTGTLSHDLNRWYYKLRNNEDNYRPVHSANNNENLIHALQDVSFEVQEGQVFGIIGRNGAGKSTLLKILSKITAPTKGNIYIKGKISSLLEVGTGFHPEMTGRENIFMNGAILGMNESEIKSKLDEIIDFSGVEKFIDTPVKRYSSGMYLKLAFSVAAHLEPDILILDEVLAVGDAEFQKKCLGKMKDVSSSGRTVLFVSHNMAAIQSITQQCMIMEKGQLKFSGPTQEAVALYMKGVNDLTNYKAFAIPTIQYQQFVVSSIGIKASTKNYADAITRDDAIDFVFEYDNQNQDEVFDFTIRVKASDGQYIFTASSLNESNQVIVKGNHQIAMQIPAYFFNYDTYYIDFLLVSNKKKAVFIENDLLSFTVNAEQKKLGEWMGKTPGYLYPNFNWSKL